MPKTLPPATRKAIANAVARHSQRWVAKAFGVCRGTVATIAATGGSPPRHKGPIAFTKVRGYWCVGCKARVWIEPCPACAARTLGLSTNPDSAAEPDPPPGVDLPPKPPEPPVEGDWMPLAVSDWLRGQLEAQIDAGGHPDSVGEATSDLCGRLRTIAAAIAGEIGSQRRESARVACYAALTSGREVR